ncbi:DEKNAAC100769 [Brettanomyces naardenensis]|uniref:ATP-dependent DNA helicase PIF1 n=1 Tax=Brettanomyces naardenensis TaxID=13370 RepID=A0A448YGA8_BRENA|nr:DEKNAAC100769 [Brettanomyces naardenensis]
MTRLRGGSPSKVVKPSQMQTSVPDIWANSQTNVKHGISPSDVTFSFSSQSDNGNKNNNAVQESSIGPASPPPIKRQKLDLNSSPILANCHNGTSLDQVMDYLGWFAKLCPQCETHIQQTVALLNRYFRNSKVVSVTGAAESPLQNNSSSSVVIVSTKNVRKAVAFSSSSQKESIGSKPVQGSDQVEEQLSQSTSASVSGPMLNDPLSISKNIQLSPFFSNDAAKTGQLVFKRTISTSSSHNAKIELMTQRPSVWNKTDAEKGNVIPAAAEQGRPEEPKKVKAITLSEEQNAVIELARSGRSIFYTGSAGTGKSLLLKSLIKALRAQHPSGAVAVTASTGLAACNIGGQTLHSFTGIGLGEGEAAALLKKVKRQQKARERWKNLEVLIIDEISMIDGELFGKLDFIARKMKKNNLPFGGIQLIVCGDFYQLPPVVKGSDPVFAFESDSWKRDIDFTIVLRKVFRQQGDKDFVRMLNEVREGHISPATVRKFKALERPLENRNGVIPAQLFPTRREVDQANRLMLRRIDGPEVVFESLDGGSLADEKTRERLLGNFLAPKMISLKKGAQVMMVKNIDDTLVNGSLGKVLDFIDPDTYSFYKMLQDYDGVLSEDTEKELMKVAQRSAADSGAAAKNLVQNSEMLDDLLDESIFSFMKDISDGSHPVPESVKENVDRKRALVAQLYSSSKGRRMPLVRFILSDGSTRDVLVEPEEFSVEDEFSKPIVSRTQIPLILAWSLSIHKAQGQTLPLVRIDLRHVFEKGQAYVALSRATSRRGLQISNFDPSKISAHERVIDFYKSLMGSEEAMAIHKRLSAAKSGRKAEDNLTRELEALREHTAHASSFPSDPVQEEERDISDLWEAFHGPAAT